MKRRCMPLILVLAAVLVLASIGWLALSKTSQAAPTPSGETSFKGKVLLVSTSSMNFFLLEKAQAEKMGGQSWLMGKGASDRLPAGWYKGRIVRIRMEQVVSITEFDDLKEAHKALESGAGRMFGPYGAPGLPAPREEAPPPGKDR
jgi:hypothetical protein